MADLCRKLSASRPEAFLPDLAMSLTTLGMMQSELGQHPAALASTQEALDALWPFFLRLPAAHERLTAIVFSNLRRYLAALNREPSAALLERIARFDVLRRA